VDVLRYLARIDARTRWRSYAGVALLLGLTAGPALLALAGARRTASAYSRFLRSVDASTVSITFDGGFDPKAISTISAFPNVERSRTSVAFNLAVLAGGKPRLTARDFEADGTFDGRFFGQDRFTPTHGRRPDPRRATRLRSMSRRLRASDSGSAKFSISGPTHSSSRRLPISSPVRRRRSFGSAPRS